MSSAVTRRSTSSASDTTARRVRATSARGARRAARAAADLAAARGDGPEPTVPPDVVDAVRGLGERLHRRGAIRPRRLLDAATEREAGHGLVTDLALDLLDRPGLTAAEQAILLDLPCGCGRPVRPRVHRLLRHRDPHVRKKAIRLLAGRDARALSASLVPLTRAEDPQTVRHALLALEEANAAWAAPAIAACLDHPNMNVKKTAAGALSAVRAPEAVPALLAWLARHDNPGFRHALVGALRATLRGAFAATVRAAADGTDDARARTRLLSVLRRTGEHPAAWLAEHGWAPEVARRAVTAETPRAADQSALRAMLPHWLGLAASGDPGASVLRFVLALCKPPWTDAELACFATSARSLADAVPHLDGCARARLLDLLAAVIPRTGPAGRRALAARLHALPPSRDVFALLHRCGDAPTGGELRRALAAARHGENPAEAETALLREAFARPPREPRAEDSAAPPPAASGGRAAPSGGRAAAPRSCEPPRTEPAGAVAGAAGSGRAVGDGPGLDAPAGLVARLRDAGRSAEAVRRLRATAGQAPGRSSREWLGALIEVFPAAAPEARDELLDWMLALQPLGVPAWTIGEEARRTRAERTPHPDDLDQPWSAVQRERLLRMLEDGTAEQRATAARLLLDRPEPAVRLPVLHAYLDGRLDIEVTPRLAGTLLDLPGEGAPVRPSPRSADAAALERFVRVVGCLDADGIGGFVPVLVEAWEHGGAGVRARARAALRRAPADLVAGAIESRVEAGERGLLDLVAGRPVLRTPVLARTVERLRADGRGDLADRLDLVDGPFRPPGAARRDAEALAALRERRDPPPEPTRAELLARAREGAVPDVRRALARLVEGARTPDPELAGLLAELLGHRERRIRLQALRAARRVLPREEYLDRTVALLEDRDSDVVLTAIRTLAHAEWAPAVPGLIALLDHPRPVVARDARDALVRLGERAIPDLRHAEGRARPDRRRFYAEVIGRIRDGRTPAPER
ncbi:HEAT repeat domain-containing protein [Actinomadura sp. WAC 06369]|uniref:HEAT repeat domain-containing protein n=1 Tax=Actinomadura sp. WAC 06369 TaxID=2203193 RepID=UPI000F79EC78|nr:HEAT repeat domain-containing protein [Actinomadura sp. WAC 06369]RSN68392.1 hypothetical protein DMH08_11135 [Actinomadura sp. WAC 06369]